MKGYSLRYFKGGVGGGDPPFILAAISTVYQKSAAIYTLLIPNRITP